MSIKTPSINGTEMSLFMIDLNSKDLFDLPDEKELSEIRKLNISKNKLKSCEFVKKTPNLIDLDASNNNISEGIEHLSLLSFINVINFSNNLFETIKGFPLIDSLSILNLSNNHLNNISELPSLPFLKELDISNNSIKELNLNSFPFLQILNLNGNMIKELNLPSLPSLRQINCNNNKISLISQLNNNDLPYLWSFKLSNNLINDSNILLPLSNLPLLFDLSISQNPLIKEDNSHISSIIVVLQKLTILDGESISAKLKVKSQLTVTN